MIQKRPEVQSGHRVFQSVPRGKSEYSPEVRERAVRMMTEHRANYPSQWAATQSIAAKIGCTPQTLDNWVKKAQSEQTEHTSSCSDAERIRDLERENRELKKPMRFSVGQRLFRPSGGRQTYQMIWSFIDQYHDRRPEPDTLVHHSGRGSQYLSICYTELLAEGGIAPSVGSKGDSYDNALAETINGL